MSNSLLEKIKNDAAAEAAAVSQASEAEVSAYEAETKQLLEKLTEEAAAKLEKEKAHLETVSLSKARQAGSIAIQAAKREGVDDIFEAVFAELKDADEKEYIQYFTELGKTIVPEKVSGVALAPKQRIDETEKILKALHADAKVESSNSIAAGFILDTKDGAFDVTLDRVFADARPRLEVELLKKVS